MMNQIILDRVKTKDEITSFAMRKNFVEHGEHQIGHELYEENETGLLEVRYVCGCGQKMELTYQMLADAYEEIERGK